MNLRIRRAGPALALAAIAAALGPGLSGPDAAMAALTRLDETAWTEKLPDGPQLLLLPQRSVPMFSCTVFVPAGSALEDRSTSGAAHYLEHLLFNGTTTRTREEIYALTDRLGAYNNASTQRERTVFQLLLPSEQWRDGLDLQADMILHSVLPADMFEKEKGIILEELAKDLSDPSYEADRFESRALWGESSRALPVLGTEESIQEMDPDAIAAYYHAHYRSAGLTVLLMGDFDVVEARDEIARLYGSSEAAERVPPRPPFPAGRRIHSAPFDDLSQIQLRIHLPLPEIDADGFAGTGLLENLLNGGEYTALANAFETSTVRPLSTSASIDAGSPWSLLTLAIDLPPDAMEADETSAESITRAVLDHLAALVTPAGDELAADFEAARRELVTDEIKLREKMHYYGLMRADVLGGAGPEAAVRLLDQANDAGTEALRLLHDALADGRLVVTVTGPGLTAGREEAPDPPMLPAHGPVAPQVPPDEAAQDPRPVTESTVIRTVFDNGFTLIVHSSPDSRTFAGHLLLRDRALVEEATGVPRGTSDVVHRLMGLGTDRLDESALRGRLTRLGASLKVTDSEWIPYDDYYFTPEYSYVRLETIDAYGPAALDLLAEVVRTPRFTAEALAQAKEGAIARARKDAGSTRAAASARFFETGWRNHPLAGRVLGPADELASLTMDDVRRHHEAMIAPSRMALVVSTNLASDRIEEAVRRGFASLPSGAGAGDLTRECVANEPARAELDLESKQAWIVVGSPLIGVPKEDEPALRIGVGILSDRLADVLREREGLAYSIGASVRFDGPGPAVMLAAGTRAENLPRMEEGMQEVAHDLLREAPTEDAVVAARNSREGRRRMRRLSRMGQAYAMAMAELRGRDPGALDEALPALQAVTPGDVLRVSQRWLDFASPTVVIAR